MQINQKSESCRDSNFYEHKNKPFLSQSLKTSDVIDSVNRACWYLTCLCVCSSDRCGKGQNEFIGQFMNTVSVQGSGVGIAQSLFWFLAELTGNLSWNICPSPAGSALSSWCHLPRTVGCSTFTDVVTAAYKAESCITIKMLFLCMRRVWKQHEHPSCACLRGPES